MLRPNNNMSDAEKKTLQTAIRTLADPNGNWDYGWQLICNFAGMDPAAYKPHFANTELRTLLQKLGDGQARDVGHP